MVQITTSGGIDREGVEEIEEKLFGTDTSEECKVILESFGVNDDIKETFIQEAEDKFDNIDIDTGLPTEIEFLDKRVNYGDIRDFTFLMEKIKANAIDGHPTTPFRIKQMINSGDLDALIDSIDHVATFQAMKDLQFFLKPLEDVQRAQRMVPRPKLAFELHYDVPRGGRLRDVRRDIDELLEDDLTGQIGEFDIIEDRGVIIAIPLNTTFEVDDFRVLDFNMSGFAEEAAEEITGIEIDESPKLERMILTCTQVGR